MEIKPIGARVLVQFDEERFEKEMDGIVIPDQAQAQKQEAVVVAVGTGQRDDAGKIIPFNVKRGDRVILPKYGGTEIEVQGKPYHIYRESDILGTIEKGEENNV